MQSKAIAFIILGIRKPPDSTHRIAKWLFDSRFRRSPKTERLGAFMALKLKVIRQPSRKDAIVQSRRKALRRILYLSVPVVFTFYTLSLSWRSLYLTSYNANQTLALLQVAAKVHDIFITFSTSEVLLYYLRRQLISERGTIFGLLGAAYSVGVGSLPFLHAFWHPFYSSIQPGKVQWRTRILVYLVIITTVIGLTANPAVSIALLPRLEWWAAQDYFSFLDSEGRLLPLSDAGFSMYIPKKLFPTVVDSASLPRQDPLMGSTLPEGNLTDSYVWATNSLSQYLKARSPGYSMAQLNTSLESDPSRNIVTSGFNSIGGPNLTDPYMPDDHFDGRFMAYRTDTLITNMILAQYLQLSIPTEYDADQPDPDGTAGGPWTMQANLPNDVLKAPRAIVWCEVRPANLTQRNLSVIFGEDSMLNPFIHDMIDLSSIWNESILSQPNQTLFEWLELSQIKDMLAGIILMPSNQYGTANVSICPVRASWTFTSMWTLPNQNVGRTISNFTYFSPIDPYIRATSDPSASDWCKYLD